jgi:hypothetical protein
MFIQVELEKAGSRRPWGSGKVLLKDFAEAQGRMEKITEYV